MISIHIYIYIYIYVEIKQPSSFAKSHRGFGKSFRGHDWQHVVAEEEVQEGPVPSFEFELMEQKQSSLELQTTSFLWLFQLDDSKSLHKKWLFHQTSIKIQLFRVPGPSCEFSCPHWTNCMDIFVKKQQFYHIFIWQWSALRSTELCVFLGRNML